MKSGKTKPSLRMKTIIKNRRDQNMIVYIDIPEGDIKGLAFVQHGFSSSALKPAAQTVKNSFFQKGHVVVNIDSTNSCNESDGKLIDCTMDTHYHDLEDVIEWASTQEWYQEPFIISGNSLGGMSSLIYATNYPKKVKAIAPIASVISYDLSVKAQLKNSPEEFVVFKKTGFKKQKDQLASWAVYETRKNYDILGQIEKITFPTLLVVGENDPTTPLEHQEILFKLLNCEKELHVVKGSGHSFREPDHLERLAQVFNQWIDKL